MSRRSTLLPLAALLLLAPACTKSAPSDDAPKAETPAAAEAPAEAAPANTKADGDAAATTPAAGNEVTTKNPKPVIKVLDAGQEPRTPLRVKVEAGQRETMTMTMTMSMDMDMGGMGAIPKMDMPPIEMTMPIHVTSVSDTGDFRYEFSLDSVTVKDRPGTPPELIEALRGSMKGMIGLSGSTVVSNRGEVREASFKVPPDVQPQIKQTMESMQQSMQQIAIPFPEEAVGIGAKWEVTSTLSQVGGINMTQVSEYEITAREGDVLTLNNGIQQNAPKQVMNAPGIPSTAAVTLQSMSSKGGGSTSFDLSRVVPVKGDLGLNSAMQMSVDAGGPTQNMSMKMDLKLDITGT